MKYSLILLVLLVVSGCLPITPVPNLDTPSPVPKTAATQARTELSTIVCLSVTANRSLNFRSGPSTSASVIGWFENNQQIKGTQVVGNWWQVESGGKIGYVHSHYVEKCHVQTGSKNKRR